MGTTKFTPEELDYATWPTVDETVLTGKVRERYVRLKAALVEWCGGTKPHAIFERYRVSRGSIHYLMGRVVAMHEDGRLYGYRALVKNTRQKEYFRTKPTIVSIPESDGNGFSGAFAKLLRDYKKAAQFIHSHILPSDGKTPKEAGLNLQALHGKFIKLLRKLGVQPHEYPFCVSRSGYGAFAEYIRQLLARGHPGAAALRYGESAIAGRQSGSGKNGLFRPRVPYELVCYDEQMLPFLGTIVIEVDGQEIEIPIKRGYLCLAVDFRSHAILGASLAISGRFSSRNLNEAIESAIRPWTPKVLTIPKMKYRAGAGLPSGVVPEAKGRRITLLCVDNHLTHLAKSVLGHLRRRIGVAIRFGAIRKWITRAAVEGVFAQLQKSGWSRIPSTTGSGPDDPAVDDPVGKAVKFKIRISDLIQVIDVVIANLNVHPRESLMSKNPLEVIKTELGADRRLSILPGYSDEMLGDPKIAVEVVVGTVRGSLAKGKRPYVQIDGGEYTNDYLIQSYGLIGEKMTLHIAGDFRSVRAFLPDGKEFGTLYVTGFWSYSAHTREERKHIIKLTNDKILVLRHEDDPVSVYHDYLKQDALAKSNRKRPRVSSSGSKIANAMYETGDLSFRTTTEEQFVEEVESAKPRGRRAFLEG
jgi:hypothetical protein